MKKLIAVSVMLALLTTAVFAEITVSGQVIAHVELAGADSNDTYSGHPNDWQIITAGGNLDRVRLGISGESENGKFGGWGRFQFGGLNNGGFGSLGDTITLGNFGLGIYGHGWWKPIEQLQLWIGNNPDCFFAMEGIAGWGFYGDANDIAFTHENYGFVGCGIDDDGNFNQGGAFFGGKDNFGAFLSIAPLDLLSLNIAIPFGIEGEGSYADYVYKNLMAQLALNFSFGTIGLTFTDVNQLYFYFGMGGGDDDAFSLDVGARFKLAKNYEVKVDEDYIHPFAIGAAFGFDASDLFGIQARLQFAFGSKFNDDVKIAPTFELDLLPYLSFGDIKVYIGLGMDIAFSKMDDNGKGNVLVMGEYATEAKKAYMGITFNPYVVIGGHFYAGLKLQATDVTNCLDMPKEDHKAGVKWSVPIGINFAF